MAFLKLIRYKNLLMVLLTMILTKYALIESFLDNTYLSHLQFSFLALSVILITAGGYIVNDIYDVETDKINKPNKIFIDVTISKKNAWNSYTILTSLGLILGLYMSFLLKNYTSLFIYLFTVFILFLYSKKLKKVLLLGNLSISLLISLVIFIIISFEFKSGGSNPDELVSETFRLLFPFWVILGYSFFSFLTTLIREIIKDIEDIDGDLKLKAKTLPILIGRKRASKVAFFFSCILFLFLIIIIKFLQDNILFLAYGIVFLIFPTIIFMRNLWTAKTKTDFSKLSGMMKLIMLFGIVSMLFFY